MTKQVRIVLVVILTLALGLSAFSTGPSSKAVSNNSRLIPGQYIVVFKDSVSNVEASVDKLSTKYGLAKGHIYKYALKGFAANVPANKLASLSADPDVAFVEEDQEMSISYFQEQAKAGGGGGSGGPQALPTGINRIDGELSSTISGNGSGSVNVDVAVIDTGIDLTHPDLNVVGGINCSSGTSYNDGNGHGTHVAGTIGAKDDANGVVGVAPGARLWAVRVLNNAGSGSTSSVMCGIDWVTKNAATIEVANMSLGGAGSDSSCTSNAYHNSICKSVAAGVTYTVAAGNESDDAANHVPAAFDEVITVSALADFNGAPGGGAGATCRADVDDTFADFSNYGADVDIIAPGVCIYSTWKGGGYNTISGTSMATPHVTGAAALYKANNPGASPAQVKSALQNAATTNWNSATDPDSTHEKLLNVDAF